MAFLISLLLIVGAHGGSPDETPPTPTSSSNEPLPGPDAAEDPTESLGGASGSTTLTAMPVDELVAILPHYVGKNVIIVLMDGRPAIRVKVLSFDDQRVVVEDEKSGEASTVSLDSVVSLRAVKAKASSSKRKPEKSKDAVSTSSAGLPDKRARDAKERSYRLEEKASSYLDEARTIESTASTQFLIGLPLTVCCGLSTVLNVVQAPYWAAQQNSLYALSSAGSACVASILFGVGAYLLYRAYRNDEQRAMLETDAAKIQRKADHERMQY